MHYLCALLTICLVPLAMSAESASVAVTTTTSQSTMAGYKPTVDVTTKAKIDLDQVDIESKVGTSPPDFAGAKATYTSGVSGTATRTLKSFSTGLGDKDGAKTLPIFQQYADYWGKYPITGDSSAQCKAGTVITSGCPNYADVMITAALNGKGDYEKASDAARAQIVKKGTAYHATWLYLIHELSEAVYVANRLDANMTFEGKKPTEAITEEIDSSWAFYVGSTASVMPESLARKRAIEFGTCSRTPDAVLTNFKAAQTYSQTATFDKAKLTTAINSIVSNITVPLVQGCIRYATLLNGNASDASTGLAGEMWVFCATVLPLMNEGHAQQMRTMIDPVNKNKMDVSKLLNLLEANYERMGFSKADVGTFNPSPTQADADKCNNKASAASRTLSHMFIMLGSALMAALFLL